LIQNKHNGHAGVDLLVQLEKLLLRYLKTNGKHQADGTTTTRSIDAIRRRNTMKKIVIEY
jgi:hypothetical protein